MAVRGRRRFLYRYRYGSQYSRYHRPDIYKVIHEQSGIKTIREYYGVQKSWGDTTIIFEPGADIHRGDIISGSGLGNLMVEDVKLLRNEIVIVGFRTDKHLKVIDLHPDVRRIAARLYEDGHYDEAISAATKALEVAVRDRSNLPAGGNLMGRAFAEGGPLDVRHHNGVTGDSEQSGFRFLFMGTSTALRNPRHHEFIADDYVSTFEHLALISLLMRRLDHAKRARDADS
jgi:uncharacterized protein (TIGR02391 family)